MKAGKLILLIILSALLSSCRDSVSWEGLSEKYLADEDVGTLIFVRCTEGSNAFVEYYLKVTDKSVDSPDSTAKWVLFAQGEAFIGKNGLGKSSEGDGKTPVGEYAVSTAFGRYADPGTLLPWKQITPGTFACDEEGRYYNTIIDTSAVHHPCKGEDMYHTSPEYDFGMALDYNPSCTYPLGSAIFFHCKGSKSWTGGCVAVDKSLMVDILRTAVPGVMVCIYPDNL